MASYLTLVLLTQIVCCKVAACHAMLATSQSVGSSSSSLISRPGTKTLRPQEGCAISALGCVILGESSAKPKFRLLAVDDDDQGRKGAI